MVSKESAVKKYIVTLSDAEREQLTALIHSGKHPAQKLLKARILLKADASDGGEGWSDSEIAAALETSIATVARTRQRLVEEGLEAALIRKHSPNSARRRIFDGAAEARLIALACSKPPAGRARWTLQLLEEAVVELKIVERASDTRTARPARLRIPPQWDGQSVHDVRATGGLAARQGHRPPHGGGLCPGAQGIIRHALSRFSENRARPGQPEHAQASIAVRSLSPHRLSLIHIDA